LILAGEVVVEGCEAVMSKDGRFRTEDGAWDSRLETWSWREGLSIEAIVRWCLNSGVLKLVFEGPTDNAAPGLRT